jgi:hypothetical protein
MNKRFYEECCTMRIKLHSVQDKRVKVTYTFIKLPNNQWVLAGDWNTVFVSMDKRIYYKNIETGKCYVKNNYIVEWVHYGVKI